MRRSSVLGLKTAGSRRRSTVVYAASSGGGRRCSLSTFTASSRIRSNSRGHVPDDDVDLCQPSLEDLPLIAGYEDLTFEPYNVPPPILPVVTEIDEQEGEEKMCFKTIPSLSAADARKLLIRYADSRCIHDKDAARDMSITSLQYQPRYKYYLESFTESRHVAWSYEAYTGDNLDEFSSGLSVPGPWSLQFNPPSAFQLHTMTETVPHTDVLMTCHGCGGVGSKRCTACSAAGWERCSFCLGDGHKTSLQGHRDRCFRCLGTGRKKCWKCAGDTIAACRGCSGTGQIRCFVAMTITWSNQVDGHTVETPESSAEINHKLEFAKATTVFEEVKQMVSPIAFPDNEEIRSLSASLIEKHGDLLATDKLLLQRHSICTIPVYHITYEWKQRSRAFFVYGANHEIYAPHYPEQICCCCILM